MTEETLEDRLDALRRRRFVERQRRRAALIRQLNAWLINVSYTLGAAGMGDLLLLDGKHRLGEAIFWLISVVSLAAALMLAPIGESI